MASVLQAKYIAQIVVAGAQIVGRAFVKALQSEVRASQQAAQARSSSGKANIRSAATDALTGMTLQVLPSVIIFIVVNVLMLLVNRKGIWSVKSTTTPVIFNFLC